SSIIIGASIAIAIGKTTEPKAASVVSGLLSLAITALVAGSSTDIRSQLAARGHHMPAAFPRSK
ncbi:MAG: hypothetical protein KAH12_12290, partial [Anaerolineales bacterium]|nr:hypothetical protein [Anaerolineales bacterium]